MNKVLITGTLGFIFSNFVRRFAYEFPIIGVDKAVYPYNLDNAFNGLDNFYLADICDEHIIDRIFSIERPSVVIGGAAESFVDNSITDVRPFLHTNIIGTQTIVNACLKYGIRYIHISTDEVFGQQISRDAKPWTENSPIAPRNPYAASKACAEHIVIAAHHTHGLDYTITRSCNVYGPRQKAENLIPHIITSILQDKPVNIHGNGENFRQYIYVNDVCDAIYQVLVNDRERLVNIGGSTVLSNIEMVEAISSLMGDRAPTMKFIPDRKAHDFGYLISSAYEPKVPFLDGMKETIKFYEAKQ